MKLFFATKKVQRMLGDDGKLERHFGKLAPTIRQRLTLLEAVENLEEAMSVRSLRIHLLKGDRKGQYAVKLDQNYRLIVLTCCERGHLLIVDETNQSEITALIIRDLAVDYH